LLCAALWTRCFVLLALNVAATTGSASAARPAIPFLGAPDLPSAGEAAAAAAGR
jgi:hypothetical protein